MKDWAETDWPQIALLYHELYRRQSTPVVALNRAVAVAMAEGPMRGLAMLDELGESGKLDDYYLFHAARADLRSAVDLALEQGELGALWVRDDQETAVKALDDALASGACDDAVVGLMTEWTRGNTLEQRDGDSVYIVQQFVPLEIWTEEQPWLDRDLREVSVRRWQTDFRCLVGPKGLLGFVGRYGGVPTNVGSGGGVSTWRSVAS